MAVANCHGGVACILCVTNAEPLHLWVTRYNWLNTHKADWRWPIIILLIGRDGQSRGQRALAGGVLDFTHRIPTPQCTLGFVKRNYWLEHRRHTCQEHGLRCWCRVPAWCECRVWLGLCSACGLERWLATLSRLSTQVRIPVGLSVPGHYNINQKSKGPRMDPFGTPHFTDACCDEVLK